MYRTVMEAQRGVDNDGNVSGNNKRRAANDDGDVERSAKVRVSKKELVAIGKQKREFFRGIQDCLKCVEKSCLEG
jgi:hypothetical protein